MTEIDAPAFELEYQDVAPFPLERFLAFISHLKVQSKDFGLVPFRLLGSQRYILDEICKGLKAGVTTFVILKSRQLGSTTFFLALDMFWAFEHAGLLGVLLTHKEEARDDFRAAIEVFFAETPRKFMVKYVRHNRNLLILRNASKFRYLIAGTQENRRGGLGRSGAANFVHSCMAPGTPVIVEHGRIKPVEHVEIGERVLTHSGAVAVVIDVVGQRNTKGDLIEITPWLGSKIAYTAEHKIPTARGMVQASEIRLTDRLVMPIRKITTKTGEIVLPPDSPRQFNRGKKSKGASAKVKLTEDFGFACGYYLAEGTVTHQSGGGNPSAICFYRHRSEFAYADRAISALSAVASRGKTQSRNGCLTDVDTAYGMPLATWMKQTFGYADNKIIPDFVFDWGEDFCRGLLCGLLCGDGSKTLTISNRKYPIARMQLPTTRSSLATQSRDLAASLGFGWASIFHIAAGTRGGRNCKEQWRVVWCGEAGRKLNALIGIEVPSGGRKQTEKYSMDYDGGRVLIGIRSLSVKENVSEIWDISVDHEDHTFRTPHMSTSNTETAFYGSGDSLNEFRSQTSSLYPHRLQIYETTANGFNHFHDMWEQAVTDPTKGAIFVGWWRDERNQFPVSHPFFRSYMPDGINTALTPLERRRVREVRDDYGFEISLQQIAWYRWHLASEKDNDQAMMDQEYPWCVIAGTRVGTDRGIIPIEQIAVGDQSTLGKVTACGPTGKAMTAKVTTSLGYELTGTLNHPLIGENDELIDLGKSKGSIVKLCAPKFSKHLRFADWREGPVSSWCEISPELARLVGLFMGDGSMQVNMLSIACDAKDQDVVEECVNLIKNIFGLTPQVREISKGGREVRIASKLIYETFKKLGLTRTDTGRTQRKVHVPEFIWQSPKDVVREFLRGLFEADGFNGYDTPRVVLFSKYDDFIKDIQLLLLGFGITCRRKSGLKLTKSSAGKTFTYVGNELQLRKEESIAFNRDIGFLSARKRMRFLRCNLRPDSDHSSFKLEMKDRVVSIEETGEQEVFNLSIEGTSLFDANGILTHNTADDAFQATGSKFFTVEAVTNITREAKKLPFQTYRYKLTHKFEETRVAQVKDARAELRIWEEPSKFGYYVVGADPAYGSSDEADRSCASVWRCFSDACIQVAEYCTPQPSTYQFAWVLAHLAGYYGANFIMPVLEISGPGQAVFDELNKVYQLTREVKPTEDEYGIRNVLQYMRHFFYKRMDSVGGGEIVYQWRTTEELKRRMMNQLKNGIELGRMVPRSLPLCEEMRRIVNDDGHIGGEGTAKDDRVMAAALAYQGFNMWVQPKAKSAGMSVARAAVIEEHGGTQPLDRLVTSFMKKMNIEVKR